MSVSAVLLFGSKARADHSAKSDTDLLFVTDEVESHHVSKGDVSMFFYPEKKLISEALSGDLFVCHIVSEAKEIYDPKKFLAVLRNQFVFRVTYNATISQAVDLGWFLVRYGEFLNQSLLLKRIVWCVRTILIARSAEMRQPLFAPERLASLARSEAAAQLLLRRHEVFDQREARQLLEQVLISEATADFFYGTAGYDDFVRRFETSENGVALKTLSQQHESGAWYS